MYTITRMRDGSFRCEGRMQDGTERWDERTEQAAVQSMIKFARISNGSYIRRIDITFTHEPEPEPAAPLTEDDWALLIDVRCGRRVALRCDDRRLKYRITDEECEMIVKIREGELMVIQTEGQDK